MIAVCHTRRPSLETQIRHRIPVPSLCEYEMTRVGRKVCLAQLERVNAFQSVIVGWYRKDDFGKTLWLTGYRNPSVRSTRRHEDG